MQLLFELIKSLKCFNFTLFPRCYYADRGCYAEHTFVRCKLLRWNRNRYFARDNASYRHVRSNDECSSFFSERLDEAKR